MNSAKKEIIEKKGEGGGVRYRIKREFLRKSKSPKVKLECSALPRLILLFMFIVTLVVSAYTRPISSTKQKLVL